MTDPKKFPIVNPVQGNPSFDTLDQAANEASKDFHNKPNIEQSLALFKGSDGKYSYSAAVTNQEHDNFGMRIQYPQGYSLAGIVHSHPGKDSLGQVFPQEDLDHANQLKIPSYIRFMRDDNIRKYTPGQTSTYMMKGLGLHVSDGDPLTLPPPGSTGTQGAMSSQAPTPGVTVRDNGVTNPTSQ